MGQFRKYFINAIPVNSFAIPVEVIFEYMNCYTVMSNEVLKEFDRKIYYAVTKIQNDRKFAEINTIYKKVIKTPIFKDISRDRLPDRVDKLLKNGTLLIKPNRDKYSLRINSNKIKYPSVNIAAA